MLASKKVKKKEKAPAEIAAATAVNAQKAKKEKAAKDTKKMKKDKYAHGGPRLKRDTVCVSLDLFHVRRYWLVCTYWTIRDI